jgi:Transcriptional regulator, AbiEi antitoxin
MPWCMHRFDEVAALAAGQSGVVSRGQILRMGLQPKAIVRAVHGGRLLKLFKGVYRLPGSVESPQQMHRAALLWAGPGAVLSHLSAAWLWEIDGLTQPPPQVSLSIPRTEVRVVPPQVRAYRVEKLKLGRDYALRNGFLCTGVARTVFDLARVLTEEQLELAHDWAARLGEEHVKAITKMLGKRRTVGRLGAGSLARIVKRENLGPTGSPLEVRVRRALRHAGIALPIPQLSICDRRTGEQIGVFDFAWPERSVIVLADGYAPHSQREVFEKDRLQWAALAANGWTIVPITWRRLDSDVDGFLSDLRAALAAGAPITL